MVWGSKGSKGSREGRAPTARCHRLGSKDRRRTVPARGACLLGPPRHRIGAGSSDPAGSR